MRSCWSSVVGRPGLGRDVCVVDVVVGWAVVLGRDPGRPVVVAVLVCGRAGRVSSAWSRSVACRPWSGGPCGRRRSVVARGVAGFVESVESVSRWSRPPPMGHASLPFPPPVAPVVSSGSCSSAVVLVGVVLPGVVLRRDAPSRAAARAVQRPRRRCPSPSAVVFAARLVPRRATLLVFVPAGGPPSRMTVDAPKAAVVKLGRCAFGYRRRRRRRHTLRLAQFAPGPGRRGQATRPTTAAAAAAVTGAPRRVTFFTVPRRNTRRRWRVPGSSRESAAAVLERLGRPVVASPGRPSRPRWASRGSRPGVEPAVEPSIDLVVLLAEPLGDRLDRYLAQVVQHEREPLLDRQALQGRDEHLVLRIECDLGPGGQAVLENPVAARRAAGPANSVRADPHRGLVQVPYRRARPARPGRTTPRRRRGRRRRYRSGPAARR